MILPCKPKNAIALYGRGIARLKKVDTQSGAAETAAAKAIDSNITEEFEHSGKR